MAFQTTWRTVDQIDTNCRPTKKGDPQVGIRTDKGEWIKISGEGVLQVKVGNKIEISEPTQFGKSWYARLNSIEIPTAKQPESKPEPAKEASNGHGNGKMDQVAGGFAFDFWATKVNQLAEWTPEAKASVLCTLMIATFDGRVKFELPGEGVLSDDDVPF